MFRKWILNSISLLLLLNFSYITTASSDLCPRRNDCIPQAVPCTSASDCFMGETCCESPCGKICTSSLLTGCQHVQREARRRAKALGREGRSVRVPKCTSEGSFESVQCNNEIDGLCWCVDELGFELEGTRAPRASLVNCTAESRESRCSTPTCRMFCPLGFALDENGCPICACRDPCDEIKCPGELACRADEVACADPPCPPVPSCRRARALHDLCPFGEPLSITDSQLPFLCGNDPGKPTCPPSFQCLVGTGNDYGVCCPFSTNTQKAGQCPPINKTLDCSAHICRRDLDCRNTQKCCDTNSCGKRCVHPVNLTECTHARRLAELLAVNERSGKGYLPQCTTDGKFVPRQCSRNGLVCWCVDTYGNKVSGSMGAAANVTCTSVDLTNFPQGRSFSNKQKLEKNCEKLDCAALCEYGFKTDENGCPTCNCDNPCEGYVCPDYEECVSAREASCTDFLCPSIPLCRPKLLYNNPCAHGTPLTDDFSGEPVYCSEQENVCSDSSICTKIKEFDSRSVCCPLQNITNNIPNNTNKIDKQPRTMCEYLRDFSDSMEGTQEGMRLAVSTPQCNDTDGSYMAKQCLGKECWCVDNFGTEIPSTRTMTKTPLDCNQLRESLECLDLTCRMGCEYGFELDPKTRCPKCQCKDPCSSVTCDDHEHCRLVEVSCTDRYCPPVPACLIRKSGQCPYLVPASSTSCDIQCGSDLACNGTFKCCSNGCGTQCTEPLYMTACQHQRAIAQHQAHESSTPAGKVYIPQCTADGAFEPTQCNLGTRECWCVDKNGFELSGSRTREITQKNCNNLTETKCPNLICDLYCEHGFVMDAQGCRTCECVEPCSRIQCRGEGEQCRMVRVECVGTMCPSIPMCLPSKENPCQYGEPLAHVTCGPTVGASTCPSTHKCQLSPLGEYAVCCPKPRDVCFEAKDEGISCSDNNNQTRWFFNPKINACQNFIYAGCNGNHNNFHTEAMCKQVCPVLSQCERLREKNDRAAIKYKKPTFKPRCDPETGVWLAVQCLEHVDVCWCVTPRGEPMKGTLIRGAQPDCNFRKARSRYGNTALSNGDIVLEEILMQIGLTEETDFEIHKHLPNPIKHNEGLLSSTRCQSFGAMCDEKGRFLPMQCDGTVCWCVDEAGHQILHSTTFLRGERLCDNIPIEAVDITIGFRGEYDNKAKNEVINRLLTIVNNINGSIIGREITTETTSNALYVRFSLDRENNVDVAFRLEKMVTDQTMENLTPDITRSQFVYHALVNRNLSKQNEEIPPPEHREIVGLSPVSQVVQYHTALVVIAAASAFIISILSLLVLLHRRSTNNSCTSTRESSIADNNERFLVCSRPVYIELPQEKLPNTVQKETSNSQQQKS